MSLPREVFRWLQGLDLSYAVKNPRRDFRNGFLIGEIISRYFPADVQTAALDTGISLKARQANWEYLSRVIRKRRLPITPQQADQMVNNRDAPYADILCALFTFFTKREIRSHARPDAGEDVAAPVHVRSSSPRREPAPATQRSESPVKPSEQAPRTSGIAATLRTLSRRPLGADSQALQANRVEFGRVVTEGLRTRRAPHAGVAPPGGSVTHTAVSKTRGGASVMSFGAAPQSSATVSDLLGGSVGAVLRRSEEGRDLLEGLDASKPLFPTFTELLAPPGTPEDPFPPSPIGEELVRDVFAHASGKAGYVSEAIARNPTQYDALLAFILPGMARLAAVEVPRCTATALLSCSPLPLLDVPQGGALAATLAFLRAVHRALAEDDASVGLRVFYDCALPRLAAAATHRGPELGLLLLVCAELCVPDAIYALDGATLGEEPDATGHLHLVAGITDALPEPTAHLPALSAVFSHLQRIGANTAPLPVAVLDVYAFFALAAFRSASLRERGLGLDLLAALARHQSTLATGGVALARSFLIADNSGLSPTMSVDAGAGALPWHILSNSLHICVVAVQAQRTREAEGAPDGEESDEPDGAPVAEAALHAASEVVRCAPRFGAFRASLVALVTAPLLAHSAEFVGSFVELLVALPEEHLRFVLRALTRSVNPAEAMTVRAAPDDSPLPFCCVPLLVQLSAKFRAAQLLAAVCEEIARSGIPRLEAGHLRLVALLDEMRHGDESASDDISGAQVFSSIFEYVFVGVSDPPIADGCAALMRSLLEGAGDAERAAVEERLGAFKNDDEILMMKHRFLEVLATIAF